jgi:uncharacterized membrane protein
MQRSIISGKEIPEGEEVVGSEIREGILALIRREYPHFGPDSVITLAELNTYRRRYIASLIEQEHGELAALDQEVMAAIQGNSILSENIEEEIESDLTFSERLADTVAAFGGSWTFILAFFLFILAWMAVNVWVLATKPFDPYPFILLNLLLSCLAAIQAPIIMMSQNRQEAKDRRRAEHDYKINLKAELEIKMLSDKIDHLLVHQSKKLLEIQELQADYLEDVMKRLRV